MSDLMSDNAEEVQRAIWEQRCPRLLAERDRYRKALERIIAMADDDAPDDFDGWSNWVDRMGDVAQDALKHETLA